MCCRPARANSASRCGPCPARSSPSRHRCDALTMARAAELDAGGVCGGLAGAALAHGTAADGGSGAGRSRDCARHQCRGFPGRGICRHRSGRWRCRAGGDQRHPARPVDPRGTPGPAVPATTVRRAGSRLRPCARASLPPASRSPAAARTTARSAQPFCLRDASDLSAPRPAQLSRSPVQTDPSLTRAPLTASLRRAVEYVDNGFGPVVIEPLRDVFERGETITLKAQGACREDGLRRWLWSLRGRQASFWLPTWGRELQLQVRP